MSVVALGDLVFNPDGATRRRLLVDYPSGLFRSGDGRLCLTCRPWALQEVVSLSRVDRSRCQHGGDGSR
jgi:hypothetical protein